MSKPDRTIDTAIAGPVTESEVAQVVPGATTRSPLGTPPAAWWAILKRVYVMTGFHNLALLAAGVAFFAFLAVVPMLACVVLLYGLLGDPQSVAQSLETLAGFVPPAALSILHQQMLEILSSSGTQKGLGLLLALLFALYGAMQAAGTMIAALNIIYEEHETRSWFRIINTALAITLCMVALAITGILAISLFAFARNRLTPWIGDAAGLLIQAVTWLVSGVLVSIIFAIFFRFAPDRRAAKWRWLTLGSVVATLLWVAITLGFGFYVANVSDYNATYGSLAAVVVFLMWLYLSAYGVLLGAELNAETERQTLVDSTVGPEKPIGERGAVMADNVTVDEASRALLDKRRRREADRRANRT